MEQTNATSSVAGEVRAWAARRGKTQKAVGVAAGIAKSSLSRKWRGETPFDVDELDRICAVLDVPITALFEMREGGTFPNSVGSAPVENQLDLFAAAA
jgi:transcriptional regulator with XRE-family HTH domain